MAHTYTHTPTTVTPLLPVSFPGTPEKDTNFPLLVFLPGIVLKGKMIKTDSLQVSPHVVVQRGESIYKRSLIQI